jgi:hypothetical protein
LAPYRASGAQTQRLELAQPAGAIEHRARRPRPPRDVLERLKRRKADLHSRSRLARATPGAPAGCATPLQRRPMRMIHPDTLFLVDLPVDVVVVLEQQE